MLIVEILPSRKTIAFVLGSSATITFLTNKLFLNREGHLGINSISNNS